MFRVVLACWLRACVISEAFPLWITTTCKTSCSCGKIQIYNIKSINHISASSLPLFFFRLGKIPIKKIRVQTAVEIMILLMFVKQAQRFVFQTVILCVLVCSCCKISFLFGRHQFSRSPQAWPIDPSDTSPFLYLFFLLLRQGLVNCGPRQVKYSAPSVSVSDTVMPTHLCIVCGCFGPEVEEWQQRLYHLRSLT